MEPAIVQVAAAIVEALEGTKPTAFKVGAGWGRQQSKHSIPGLIQRGEGHSKLGDVVYEKLRQAHALMTAGPPAGSDIPKSSWTGTWQEWLDLQLAQKGAKKGTDKTKAQAMRYLKARGDEHKAHRDHDNRRWKLTLCLSPYASGCVHTGCWESQRVVPGRSRLTLEKEKTIVPSDGQWIAFTPWSNAVNSHLWGFGKVTHTPSGPLASAVSSGRGMLASIQFCRQRRRPRRLATRAPTRFRPRSRPVPQVRGVARYRAHEVNGHGAPER